ncbi:MAG: BrnT family toxin [Lachnospiraceae bacterium]|jgi:uncharacterized DUF497 family protein|nr:BrnT family toxin [Lachnospiraceae bacterium]
MVGFEWDEGKNRINIKKHGISFEEASTAFLDEEGLYLHDFAHSVDEERFLLLGMSSVSKLLVVCHCISENNGNIRIISARRSTKNESKQYYDKILGVD